MEIGQIVKAETFDHRLIDCRLVEIQGHTALVCSEREWKAARRQKREPDCLGWPLGNIRQNERLTK